jgi:hypothetical protein
MERVHGSTLVVARQSGGESLFAFSNPRSMRLQLPKE